MADPGLLFSVFLTSVGASALAAVRSSADPADISVAQTEPMPPSLPKAVDLRSQLLQWGLVPRRQGPRGTCSVFTAVGALECAAAKVRQQGTRLSVEFLNWAGHRAADRTADGGFFSELWDGYTAYGICPEENLPYQAQYDAALEPGAGPLEAARAMQRLGLRWHWIKEWDPETGLTAAQLDAIKTTLARGWPVCGGFRWPKQARWEQDVLQICPPNEVYDGHSVLLVGYRDDECQPGGGLFLIRNSAGDGRDGCLPYAYLSAYMNDAAWVQCDGP